jgi:glycine dehydrogenase
MLMVEPTESEDVAELDRFVDAMVAIKAEIDEVAAGTWTAAESPLRGAPHTALSLTTDEWSQPYRREVAAFPLPSLRAGKYWPPVRRIDGAAGDRHLVCSCPPIEAYIDVRHGDDAVSPGSAMSAMSAVPSTVDGSIPAAPVANPDRVTDLSSPPTPQPFSGRMRP